MVTTLFQTTFSDSECSYVEIIFFVHGFLNPVFLNQKMVSVWTVITSSKMNLFAFFFFFLNCREKKDLHFLFYSCFQKQRALSPKSGFKFGYFRVCFFLYFGVANRRSFVRAVWILFAPLLIR